MTPKGHFTIESYLYVTANTGAYDKHWHGQSLDHNFYSIIPQFFCQFGMTPWMDFQIVPEVVYNITQDQSSVHFGDLPIGFDFQLYPADAREWVPGVKLTLREIFPTGKYQKLSRHKKGTDLSGEGSFATNASLEFYKVSRLWKKHFLSTTFYFSYLYSAPVHVKGLNAYGGGHHTRGKAYPGNALEAILSFEFTFNQNWVFAIDNVYMHTNKNRFTGHPGFTEAGKLAPVKAPSSEQISFAPTIEYNFNSHFGIAIGAWVTAWGRNSIEFRSGIIDFDYTY